MLRCVTRYYSKLPTEVTADLVFLLDRKSLHLQRDTDRDIALIATGGTAIAAIGMLLEWGLVQSQIKIISVLGSRQGVDHVAQEFPDVEVSRASSFSPSCFLPLTLVIIADYDCVS